VQARTPAGWFTARPAWQRHAAYQVLIAAIVFLGVFKSRAFIYFQF
jgi:hypothetical protein